MPTYHVTWEIDIDAKTPKAAAREALKMQRDPQSTATVFSVAVVNTIDLEEINPI